MGYRASVESYPDSPLEDRKKDVPMKNATIALGTLICWVGAGFAIWSDITLDFLLLFLPVMVGTVGAGYLLFLLLDHFLEKPSPGPRWAYRARNRRSAW
jgi:hypothetical protein